MSGQEPTVVYVVHRAARNRLLNALLDELHPERARFEVVTLEADGPMVADLAERGVPFTGLGFDSMRTLHRAVLALRPVVARAGIVVNPHGYVPGLAVELARASVRRPAPSVLERHHNREHHLQGIRRHVVLDGWSARHASHVVAVSRAVRDTLVEEGVPAERVTVSWNGVDWDRLVPDEAGVARWRAELGGPLVVAAGRLHPIKDLDSLVRAFALVHLRHPTAVLAVAGVGTPDEEGRLEALAGSLGIGHAVHLLGWVDALEDLLAAADVVAQASLDESFGQVVAEAMGLGVPVAVTTPGGIADIVGDHQPAVAPGDVEGLAAVLGARLDDPGAARAAAAAAAPGVRDRFARRAMADGHLRLYQQLSEVARG